MVNISVYDAHEMSHILEVHHVQYRMVKDHNSDRVMFYCDDNVEFARGLARDFSTASYWVKLPKNEIIDGEFFTNALVMFGVNIVRFRGRKVLVSGDERNVLALYEWCKSH